MQLKHYFRGFIEDDRRFRMMTPASDSLSAGIQVVEIAGKNAGMPAHTLPTDTILIAGR
jgi:hypothetical protein